jgi:hypothetical protein
VTARDSGYSAFSRSFPTRNSFGPVASDASLLRAVLTASGPSSASSRWRRNPHETCGGGRRQTFRSFQASAVMTATATVRAVPAPSRRHQAIMSRGGSTNQPRAVVLRHRKTPAEVEIT